MIDAHDIQSMFGQLLHGLLHNLQPMQQEQQLHSSPLREASKDILATTCQLMGSEIYLQQVLQSVAGFENESVPLDSKSLEVGHACLCRFDITFASKSCSLVM